MTRRIVALSFSCAAMALASCARPNPTQVVFELTSRAPQSIERGTLVVSRQGATDSFGPPIAVDALDAQLLVRLSRVDDPAPLVFTYTGTAVSNRPIRQRARVRFIREQTVFASMSIDPDCTTEREAACAAMGDLTCGAGASCVAIDVPVRERLPDGGFAPLDATVDAQVDATVDAQVDATVDAQVDATVDGSMDADSGDVRSDRPIDSRDDVVTNPPLDVVDARVDVVDASDSGALPPPRLIAPISTSVVMTRTPRFQFTPSPGVVTHTIEFCSDRSCSTVLSQVLIGMVSFTPTVPLGPGWVFWRMRSRIGAVVGPPSPVWQVYVPNGLISSRATTHGGTIDLDGDGLSELVSGAFRASGVAGTEAGLFRFMYGHRSGDTRRFGSVVGTQARGHLGIAIASAGDVNGDGYGDLIVGADNEGASDAGRAHLFFGGPTGIRLTSDRTLVGPVAGGRFGAAVAGLGDVNSDGYGDVAIGAPGNATRAGLVYLVFGGPFLALHGTTISSTRVGDGFGSALSAGDTNGDGFAELAIGAPGAANGAMTNAGAVELHRYNVGTSRFEPITALAGSEANAQFGTSVALNGDLSGDGLADLIASAPGLSAGAGGVAVHLGRTTPGVDAMPFFTNAGASGDGLGNSVTHLGDLTGDGIGDFAAGAWTASSNNGRWIVYAGSNTTRPTVWFTRNSASAVQMGSRVGGVGDFNGDNLADLAFSAWLGGGSGSVSNGGFVRMFFGTTTPPMGAPVEVTLLSGTVANELLGVDLVGR